MYLTPDEMSSINSASAGSELFKKKEQEQREKQLLLNNSNKQVELLQAQINILKQQLKKEKKKINELYELKDKELEDSTKKLKKSKIYNMVMLGIAIASLVATILIGIFL